MLNRTEMPPVQPLEPAVLLPAQAHTLAGVPVYVLTSESAPPVLKVEWYLKAGKITEAKPGAAYFAAELLKGGTETLSSSDIVEHLARYGASLSVTPHLDYSSLTLVVLTKFADALIPWVTRLLWESEFPEVEMERERNKKRQALQIDLEKTGFLASTQLRRELFGSGHAYGNILGLEELEAIQRTDVVAHHRERYHRQALTVLISGNIDAATLKGLETALAEGPSGMLVDPATPEYTPKPGYTAIPRPGVQATLRMGTLALPKAHPDYHRLRIVNELFGGYFGSRLMQNLREDKGLTYGIYSTLIPLYYAHYLSIGADIKKTDVDLAVSEIRKEIEILHTSLVTEEELSRVKTHLAGKVLSQLSSPFAHADVFKALHFHNRDTAHFERFFTELEAITPEGVQRIAREYLPLDGFVTVVAGADTE